MSDEKASKPESKEEVELTFPYKVLETIPNQMMRPNIKLYLETGHLSGNFLINLFTNNLSQYSQDVLEGRIIVKWGSVTDVKYRSDEAKVHVNPNNTGGH